MTNSSERRLHLLRSFGPAFVRCARHTRPNRADAALSRMKNASRRTLVICQGFPRARWAGDEWKCARAPIRPAALQNPILQPQVSPSHSRVFVSFRKTRGFSRSISRLRCDEWASPTRRGLASSEDRVWAVCGFGPNADRHGQYDSTSNRVRVRRMLTAPGRTSRSTGATFSSVNGTSSASSA